MAEKITLGEYERAEGELRTEERRRNFFVHAAIYLTINVTLIIFNVLFMPAYPWFLFPLVYWGIGLIAHFFVAFRWIQSENEHWIAQVEYRASKLHRTGSTPVELPAGKAA